jgi:hypothetical protein
MHGPWRLLQVFAPSLLRAAILGLGLLAGTPLSAAEEQRAILPVTVNEVEKGDFLVILRSRDVLVRVGDLEVAGVHGFGGRRAQFGSDEFVSLESLAPGVNFGLGPPGSSTARTPAPFSTTG